MNDKKNRALCYFHAYGKVCLTISAQRIWRAPGLSAHEATPKAVGAYATHMWAVGMALCLPTNRDTGTRRRGRVVAEGRAQSCCTEMSEHVDVLPSKQLAWRSPIEPNTAGQYLMNEDALDHLLSKLRLMEHKSRAGVIAVDAMINRGGGLYLVLINTLKRLRKLAAAHDGSAGLYKAYKEVFNTGSL